MLAGDEVTAGFGGVAEAEVALVEAGVEVTVVLAGEGGRLAAGSDGSDVTAEVGWHGFSPGSRGVPPWGYLGLKLNGCNGLAWF